MKLPVTPWVLAGRILAILGMGFTAAVAILFYVGGFWLYGLLATAAFLPFFLLIVVVERYSVRHGLIGPPEPATDTDEEA
ncbi:MAG: hypothetical protein RMK15_00345 [Chloroflexota bacterium]|jgi:hypothetical protein|nr:hypothetical protein [Dehalococcoidia bacterium]MDW8045720.1 hypothetical protein [Chloroflexota bacterium]